MATDPVLEMERAVLCLALEVDESIYADVRARWLAVATKMDRLRTVASAALKYMEEGGEHPTDDGLHIGSAVDAAALNAALDALGQD